MAALRGGTLSDCGSALADGGLLNARVELQRIPIRVCGDEAFLLAQRCCANISITAEIADPDDHLARQLQRFVRRWCTEIEIMHLDDQGVKPVGAAL